MLLYRDLKDIESGKTVVTLRNFLIDFYGWDFDFINYSDSDESLDILSWSEENDVNISHILYAIEENKNNPVHLEIANYDPDDEWFNGYIIVNDLKLDVSCSVFMK